MKRIMFALAIVAIMATSAFAADKKLAAKYLEIVPMRMVVDATLQKLFPGDEQRVAGIVGRMDFSGINRVMIEKMAKNFSDRELKAAIAYHSSPEGKSFSRKMPLVVDSVAPMLQDELQKALAADPVFQKR